MRDVIANWQGTDAELLTALNLKQFKRKVGDGMVTLAMIGDLGVELVASLSLTLDMVIENMPLGTQAEQAAKSMLVNFANRLRVSDRGLDFHNDTVRTQFTQILLGAGWQQSAIDAVLGLGAVYDSHADRALGRSAIQSDVNAVRHDIWVAGLQTKANHAVALFIDAASESETQWTTEEQADQLLAAWEGA